jgi:hypothetical protein
MVLTSPHLEIELESRVNARTGHRVRNLAVELRPERIVLRGLASTYHVKQLAQQEICDILPNARLENAIEVNESGGSGVRSQESGVRNQESGISRR